MKPETAPRFSGIGGHHSHKAGTVEWVTPPAIVAALGPFDLDPCAAIAQPWPMAARSFTRRDNGLLQRWEGRVWLNPPYSNGVIEHWLARLAEHDRGTALIFARTETEAFQRHVFERASALLFMSGRVTFFVGEAFTHPKTGKRYEVGQEGDGNAGAPTVLCAYGVRDADVLAACSIAGQFVPLRIPRSVIVSLFAAAKEGEKIDTPWSALVRSFLEELGPGPVPLADLYRRAREHPKAASNRNVDAKVRQELQRGAGRRVQPGLWERAG